MPTYDDLCNSSVKELRRQAALRNVPLTRIAAALEKQELIALILNAPPVRDQYNIDGPKVWDAESIAADALKPKPPKKKKKKKKKGRSDSSSSKSSSSRHKKSKKHKHAIKQEQSVKQELPVKQEIQDRSALKRPRERDRSSSVEMMEMVVPSKLPALPAVSEPSGAPTPPKPRVRNRANASSSLPPPSDSVALVIADDDPPPSGPSKPSRLPVPDTSVAEAGMAAAAALGFSVLPKAPRASNAPAAGLRPSVTSASSQPLTSAYAQGRVCIEYLCKASCQLGANCPDVHIRDPEEEMRVRSRFKDQDCHFGAACTRSFCLYRHPGEQAEELTFVPEGQQVMLRSTSSGVVLDFS